MAAMRIPKWPFLLLNKASVLEAAEQETRLGKGRGHRLRPFYHPKVV